MIPHPSGSVASTSAMEKTPEPAEPGRLERRLRLGGERAGVAVDDAACQGHDQLLLVRVHPERGPYAFRGIFG